MIEIRKNLIEADFLLPREKERLSGQEGPIIEFSLFPNTKTSIKEFDNQRNPVDADILIIETSTLYSNPDETILKKISEINNIEPLGIFLHNPEKKELIFRTSFR